MCFILLLKVVHCPVYCIPFGSAARVISMVGGAFLGYQGHYTDRLSFIGVAVAAIFLGLNCMWFLSKAVDVQSVFRSFLPYIYQFQDYTYDIVGDCLL